MADKRQIFFQGTLGSTPGGLLYANVTGEEAAIQQIRVHNTSASPVTDVRVSIGADAPGTRTFGSITLQPGETKTYTDNGVPLTGTTQIQGSAAVAGAIACLITGSRRLV